MEGFSWQSSLVPRAFRHALAVQKAGLGLGMRLKVFMYIVESDVFLKGDDIYYHEKGFACTKFHDI